MTLRTSYSLIDFIYTYEPTIRLNIFLGSFALLALWEWLHPRRELVASKLNRWAINFGLIVTSTLLLRFIIPTAIIGVAYFAEEKQIGIFNYFENIDFWIKCVASFILLDFIIYFQHLFFHVLPILWRFHRIHHSDQDCDVTTGVRFHPVEIIISVIIKISAVIILGAPVLTVILFEITLNFMSMFTHSNIKLNNKVEPVLRWFITTPEMHRVHHSVRENETNSNFTFFISLWDRVFGTYLDSPLDGHLKMTLGLLNYNKPSDLTFLSLLQMPIRSIHRGYAINHRDTRNADELERINTQLNIEIMEKDKQATDLVIARDIAEKANKAKSKFISNMSHELRTPMHGILSYSTFGISKIEKVPHKKLLSYFKNINASGERLLYLINNLLDLAKLESGTYKLNKKEVDLTKLIKICMDEQQARLEEKNLNVDIQYLTEKTIASVDTELIIQVIVNLLSNAIKFSPENSSLYITVSNTPSHSHNIPTNNNQLYFSIKDTGMGIPVSELEDIFVSFNQSTRTETGAGGTGLGLAISKDIIEAHNGGIWAENNSDTSGATFTFAIPIS